MRILEEIMPGLFLLESTFFGDSRGFFMETYHAKAYESILGQTQFVQDNLSLSHKGVVRGLHFQAPPHAQGKLVSVLRGKVLDVVVDIRVGSPTYGKHACIELSEENHRQLFVAAGFAHGFTTLEDHTLFYYKCTNFYYKPSEGCLLWNDPDLGINWGIADPIISEKDKVGTRLKNLDSPYIFA